MANRFNHKSKLAVLLTSMSLGLALGVGLTVTGIFAPFGAAVSGLILAGIVLFLASACLGVLINKCIRYAVSEDVRLDEDNPSQKPKADRSLDESVVKKSMTSLPLNASKKTPELLVEEVQEFIAQKFSNLYDVRFGKKASRLDQTFSIKEGGKKYSFREVISSARFQKERGRVRVIIPGNLEELSCGLPSNYVIDMGGVWSFENCRYSNECISTHSHIQEIYKLFRDFFSEIEPVVAIVLVKESSSTDTYRYHLEIQPENFQKILDYCKDALHKETELRCECSI